MNTLLDLSLWIDHSIWNATWQASILALTVFVTCRVVGQRMQPGWQFLLWGVVFVRFACPLLPSSIFSAENLIPQTSQPVSALTLDEEYSIELDAAPSMSETDRVDEQTHFVSDSISTTSLSYEQELVRNEHKAASEGANSVAATDDTIGEEIEAQESAMIAMSSESPVGEASLPVDNRDANQKTFGSLVSWIKNYTPLGLFSIWFSGVLFSLVKMAIRRVRLNRIKSGWHRVDDPVVNRVFEECKVIAGVKHNVELRIAESHFGPALLGWLRPTIVLPASVVAKPIESELRLILLHELMHIRRNDVIWDRFAEVVAAIHWFNPIARWSLSRLRQSREYACDAAVLNVVGHAETKSYGLLIMKLAVAQRTQPRLAPLVGIQGQRNCLSERIKMIANSEPKRWSQKLVGAGLLILFVLCGLTSAKPYYESVIKSETIEVEETQLAEPLQDSTFDRSDEVSGEATVIAGKCSTKDGQVLGGVKIQIFEITEPEYSRKLVSTLLSDENGEFRVEDLPTLTFETLEDGERPTTKYHYYSIALAKEGFASQWLPYRYTARNKSGDKLVLDAIEAVLQPAASIAGRVTNKAMKPVAGAKVWIFRPGLNDEPINGIQSTITDDDGNYRLVDVSPNVGVPSKNAVGIVHSTYVALRFSHPEYATQSVRIEKTPEVADMVLQNETVIRGRVLDRVTGRPASGVVVSAQGSRAGQGGWQQVTTNMNGNYELKALRPGAYNIWADMDERACIAIDSAIVGIGETLEGQDIELVEGAWLEGIIIDDQTGKPLGQWGNARGVGPIRVGLHGPARPKSGPAVQSVKVDEKGRFGIRVPPGKNYPYLMFPDLMRRVADAEKIREGIEVQDGELVPLEFRILAKEPKVEPKLDSVDLPIPVREERAAAAAVRRLGGWYKLDDDKHVFEVNMVYHYDEDKQRFDNPINDSDKVISALVEFPKLTHLYLKQGQVKDDSMEYVEKLSQLKTFFVWDAHSLTDKGVEHLRELRNLESIHISESQISDGAMDVFSNLPRLTSLSIQHNKISDEGVEKIRELENLTNLWIGMSSNKLTDRSLKAVCNLPNLETLSIQRSSVTDEGMKHLEKLPNLKSLYIGGAGADKTITDESVETLAKLERLESLSIVNCDFTEVGLRKICELPLLRRVTMQGAQLNKEQVEKLKEDFPRVRFSLSTMDRGGRPGF